MDTVRFGRALGLGARSAARTLIQAVDAATAENPSRNDSPLTRVSEPESVVTPRTKARTSAARTDGADRRRGGVLAGISRFRDLALKPFVRLSGVLLLEICGVFFG